MIRPEVGQVAEWAEHRRDIKGLLALRWLIEHGRVTDWCEHPDHPMLLPTAEPIDWSLAP